MFYFLVLSVLYNHTIGHKVLFWQNFGHFADWVNPKVQMLPFTKYCNASSVIPLSQSNSKDWQKLDLPLSRTHKPSSTSTKRLKSMKDNLRRRKQSKFFCLKLKDFNTGTIKNDSNWSLCVFSTANQLTSYKHNWTLCVLYDYVCILRSEHQLLPTVVA